MEELKKTAKENEKKGFEFIWNIYEKFNKNVDKFLSKMLDEKEDQKFGLIDLYKWLRNKSKKINKKIETTDEKLFDEKAKKEKENEKDNNTALNN